MSTVVWKHPIEDVGADLKLIAGARVLHVAEQNGVPCLWEAHDPGEMRTEVRRFRLVGTGHAVDVDSARHLGTVLLLDGKLVLHLFETTQ